VRKTHQIAVRSRRIDNDEIEGALDRADRRHEFPALRRLVLRDLHGLARRDAAMNRKLEVEAGASRPGPPIADVTGEALLPAVEIDGGDALARLEQGHGHVQRGGGFSRTALLVAQHHNMRRARLLTCLHQHDLNLYAYLPSRTPPVKGNGGPDRPAPFDPLLMINRQR